MCIPNTYKIGIIEKGKSIGNKLLYHRKLANLTQDALSKIIGIDSTTIKDIEKDKRLPGREISRKLAIYFKLDTKFFYDEYLEETDNANLILKEYREKNNLTIKQAATRFNVAQSIWSVWESKSGYIGRKKYSELKKLGIL